MTSKKQNSVSITLVKFLPIIIFALTLLLTSGCEDRKDHTDLPKTHSISWNDPSSVDFHGTVVLGSGISSCTECHGLDLDGGKVSVSCVDCHVESGACAKCHGGGDNSTGAPPVGLRGETSTTSLAVGAHTVHLESSGRAAAVTCEACHLVPTISLDSSHYDGYLTVDTIEQLDSIAEIIWGRFSDDQTDGDTANWNRATGECSNVYCHGDFSGGHQNNLPIWTDSASGDCGSCHAYDQAQAALLGGDHDFHVNTVGLICADCHASVIDDSLRFVDPTLHVNGLLDTLTADPDRCALCHGGGTGSCVTCHGGGDNTTGAPPSGLRGESEATDLAVGAHTTHLSGSVSTNGYACTTCHLVPMSVSDNGHLGNDSIAEISWSALAGPDARYDRPSGGCVDSYCHGNFSGGNRLNRPRWNGVDQAACGSCHDVGSSPAQLGWKHNFHVAQAGLDCSECHGMVVDRQLNIVGRELHANGSVDLDTVIANNPICQSCHGVSGQVCTLCHGGLENQTGAPPSGLFNVTSTDSIGVGAHTTHVKGLAVSNGIDCSTCHVVPLTADEPQHQEVGQDNIAEITWSGLAGGSASWDRVSATCADTYCHGNFIGGNNSNAPVWTEADQAACGTCHDAGVDPASLGGGHPTHAGLFETIYSMTFDSACYLCHGNVVDQNSTITDLTLHVNGQVDSFNPDPDFCATCHAAGPEACIKCHGGTDNLSGAPPTGLNGETATTELAVGAHTAHLEGRIISDGIACSECHINPTSFADAGHYDTDFIAELTWGSLAGVNSSWNRVDSNCADTYCHGDFRGGKALNLPVWTATDQALCGSCHDVGNSPGLLRDEHDKHVRDKNIECYECHATTVDAGLSIVGLGLHINGINDVSFSDSNPAVYDGNLCSNNECHDNKAW